MRELTRREREDLYKRSEAMRWARHREAQREMLDDTIQTLFGGKRP